MRIGQAFGGTQEAKPSLPAELLEKLEELRRRYAGALEAAARGDYSRARELRSISYRLGRLLAEEARKSPEERGGLRMVDISLSVDAYFVELRGFTRHEMARRQMRRLQQRDRAS